MSAFVHSVCVVTSMAGYKKSGITVSSLASVSAEPPSILVCIHHHHHTLDVLEQSQYFAINLLSQNQREIAKLFAKRHDGQERFDSRLWARGAAGSPVLKGALVTMECKLFQIVPASTHQIVIGNVLHLNHAEEGSPLLYHRRRYHHLSG